VLIANIIAIAVASGSEGGDVEGHGSAKERKKRISEGGGQRMEGRGRRMEDRGWRMEIATRDA